MSISETTFHCDSSDLEVVDPIGDDSWDQRILAQANATIFHSSAWARVLNRAFGYKPFYFCLNQGNQLATCLAVMEIDSPLFGRKGKTLPFTDYCDFLGSDRGQGRELLDDVLEFGRSRKWKSYELRGGTEVLETVPAYRTCYSHIICLESGADQVYAKFRGSTRQNIKRALRGGVEVQHHNSIDSVKTYYRLHCITRKRQGYFTQPFALFQKIYEELIAKGLGFVSLAVLDGQPIAAAIYFHTHNHACYAYGASDKSFQHHRPNNLLMWEAIQRCSELKCRKLDLGTTEDTNNGLRQFKNGMAATEKAIHYYKYDFRQSEFMNHNKSRLNDLRLAIGNKLPSSVLNAVGSLLYKHHG